MYEINNKKLELLMKDEYDYPYFLIYYPEQLFEYWCDFEVYEVTARSMDNIPRDIELYLEGTIKWDGCSHITFGDEGYIHMCGKRYFDLHSKLMPILYETVRNKIEHYNKDVAE